MSKYYSEDPEYSKISLTDKLTRDKLEAILESFSRNLNYSYSCSDEYGVPEDRFDDVAEKIMDEFGMWDKTE